jgi:Exonuclease III
MKPPQPPLIARQGLARKNSKFQIEQPSQYQDYFGHKLRKKKESSMRVLLCNPNGITGPGKFSKISRIQQKALTYQLDVLCMVEQSQNLKRIPTQWQLRNLTQGWWQHRRVAQAYNRQFDSGKESQVGGVSLTINDSLAHRSTTINNDPTGLGRWTSILVKGTQGFSTRIICAYRPCKSSGPDTAYIQHAIYFNQINRKGDPRKMFMEDLADAIVKWRSRGEQIILTGDFNTGDKTSSSRQQSFWDPWLRTTGLVDVHKQVIKNKDIPSTHERGTVRIDYMFVSPSLRVKRAGFLPFSKFPGDHRAIWMDVDLKDVIGHKPPALSMAQARRLRVQDPRIVQRYLSSLTQSAENNNLFLRLDTLHSLSPNQWTQQHTQEYEEISHLFRTSMLQAESTCRKLHTGKHPWSPLFETARRRKFYWELTVKSYMA